MKVCPYCEKASCEHKLVESSVYNMDWYGPLPEATGQLSQALEEAVFKALQDDDEPLGGSVALDELFARAREEAPESVDDFEGMWVRDYWLTLADNTDGVQLQEFNFDGGGPGTGERYRDVYAEDPKRALERIIAAAREDLACMRPPPRKKAPVKKAKPKPAAKKKAPRARAR